MSIHNNPSLFFQVVSEFQLINYFTFISTFKNIRSKNSNNMVHIEYVLGLKNNCDSIKKIDWHSSGKYLRCYELSYFCVDDFNILLNFQLNGRILRILSCLFFRWRIYLAGLQILKSPYLYVFSIYIVWLYQWVRPPSNAVLPDLYLDLHLWIFDFGFWSIVKCAPKS